MLCPPVLHKPGQSWRHPFLCQPSSRHHIPCVLGLQVGSLASPTSLARCPSHWPTPVSIPNGLSVPTSLFQRSCPCFQLSHPSLGQSPELSFPWVGPRCAEIPPPLVQGMEQPLMGQLCQSNPIPDPPSVPNECGHFLSVLWQKTGKHCPGACDICLWPQRLATLPLTSQF